MYPLIGKLLQPKKIASHPGSFTSYHLFALERIIEELRNHKEDAVITFIDFKKAFDSIDRSKSFKTRAVYKIFPEIFDATRVIIKSPPLL